MTLASLTSIMQTNPEVVRRACLMGERALARQIPVAAADRKKARQEARFYANLRGQLDTIIALRRAQRREVRASSTPEQAVLVALGALGGTGDAQQVAEELVRAGYQGPRSKATVTRKLAVLAGMKLVHVTAEARGRKVNTLA